GENKQSWREKQMIEENNYKENVLGKYVFIDLNVPFKFDKSAFKVEKEDETSEGAKETLQK
ncbi:hypothetical protein, partial [Anaerostipes hadrus]|uniref:hypothetical protein n=1 Tax=Anaerostipes hadrus TaxID=649756 RepID=UPI001ADDC179